MLMTEKRRPSRQPDRIWPASEYTLLEDAYTTEEGVTYSKGETFALRQREATRLGNAGVIAPPAACRPSGPGSKRDEYLYRMWELAGEWED
jgi:hypothetical protein